jgi:hypothetical protein
MQSYMKPEAATNDTTQEEEDLLYLRDEDQGERGTVRELPRSLHAREKHAKKKHYCKR